MFERFTDRARRVVVLAQEEARLLHHPYIAPEHLLLGLLRNDGLAAKALESLGVSLADARGQIEERLGMGTGPALEEHIPFTRGAKKVLELSLREALSLGHNYIGTEHILLGVFRESRGDADSVVAVLGVDLDRLRARIIELLAEYAPPGSPGPRPGLRGMLPPEWSPALLAAERRARNSAAGSPVTTGHVLVAILGDLESQGAKALIQLGISTEAVESTLAEIPVAETSDAPPPPPSVDFTVGGRTVTIGDPGLAAALSALSPDELRAALRKAVGADPASGGSDDPVPGGSDDPPAHGGSADPAHRGSADLPPEGSDDPPAHGGSADPAHRGSADPPPGGSDDPPAHGGSADPPPGGSDDPPAHGGSADPPPGGSTDPPPGGSTDPPPGGSTDPPPGGSDDPPAKSPADPAPEGSSDPAPGG